MTAATRTTRKTDSISRRRQRRMPLRRALVEDGVRLETLQALVGALQGANWENAIDNLMLETIESPAATRAICALTIEAVARHLGRVGAPPALQLFQYMLCLDYVSAEASRAVICYQLLLQAEHDAKGKPTGDRDRFADFTSVLPRDAMVILIYALVAIVDLTR